MNAIAFQVPGAPAPKGSTRAFVVYRRGRFQAAVTNDNPRTRPWAAVVRNAAIMARHDWIKARGLGIGAVLVPMFARPAAVRIELEFVLPRVTKLPRRRMVPHTSKPDLDKLTRAALDALTGVLYEDDSQVCAIVVTKRYAMVGEAAGCGIGVDALAPAQEPEAATNGAASR